jgi:beta-1,4-mannosyl-glycoprotein beta-1,4-N-acetylglucosaminyltransferase
MAIFDCFMFNDEIDLLKFRIGYYWQTVERFIVAESRVSFSGAKKELLALKTFERLGIDKNRYTIIDYTPSMVYIKQLQGERWPIERYARQSLSREIRLLNPSDTVMLSDVDEIASIEQIKMYESCQEITSLLTPLSYRKANWISIQGRNWRTFKIGPAKEFDDLNEIRYRKTRLERKFPGAHFSYLSLSTGDVVSKSNHSAHKEHQLNLGDAKSLMSFADDYMVDHLGRFERQGFGLLKVIKPKNLSTVGLAFFKYEPKYYSFVGCQHSKLKRMAAANLISNSWRTGTEVREFKARIFPLISAIPLHYLNRIKGQLVRKKKRVNGVLRNLIHSAIVKSGKR